MIANINDQLSALERAIQWSKKYPEENLESTLLERKRREIKRVKNTLEINCSVAAYGESQVGKSYLMSSLLSTPTNPFEISDGDRKYSFIDEINTSGGNLSQTESTGIVTRFTTRQDNATPRGQVKITLFSIADILTMLCDSYYNDLKLDVEDQQETDLTERLRNELKECIDREKGKQEFLTEDDLFYIYEYIKRELGLKAQQVVNSRFPYEIGASIEYIHPDRWSQLFSFLWHDNPSITQLFSTLIRELKKLHFASVVYVPFRAVLREYGSILKVEWLDYIMSDEQKAENSSDEPLVDVFGATGLLCKDFRKSSLSALIAELTFTLPSEIATERPFLKKLDLLDFPGARSRLQIEGHSLSQQEGERDIIPALLRRGKVAYLFNKYSHALLISAVLFCHHNDQRTEATLGNTITQWINENIGKNEAERSRYLKKLQGVSPLFFIGTKFNKELVCTKMDVLSQKETSGENKLSERWKRFDVVIPELIGTARWFDHWSEPDATQPSSAFQSIYLLRDYYWSGKDRIFVGYSDGANKSPETGYAQNSEYPDFIKDVRQSFIDHPFVKAHFRDPEKAWDSVATPRNDGSKAIIEDLNKIAGCLDAARRERYTQQLNEIKESTLSLLEPHYESEELSERNKRIQKVVGSIRRSTMEVGNRPEIFGYAIDSLMIPASLLHRVAYDILILQKETPKDLNAMLLLRETLGISGDTSADQVKQLVEGYFGADSQAILEEYGVTLEELSSGANELNSTIEKLLAFKILTTWQSYLSSKVEEVKEYIHQAADVIDKLIVLAKSKKIKRELEQQIEGYIISIQEKSVLPTFIADYASLFLNHFVCTMGSDFVDDDDRRIISQRAEKCSVIHKPTVHIEPSRGNKPIDDVITGLAVYNNPTGSNTVTTIMKSSFFKQFQLWQGRVIDCILLTSDASTKDPVANKELGDIIASTQIL